MARVSPATVSRVAQDNPSVDAGIRSRVKAAAARLGIALGERRAESHRMLAFLLGNRDVLHSFQARVLVGAENFCAGRNWELVFLCFRYTAGLSPGELHLPMTLLRRTVARAAILAGVNYPNIVAALRERGIPFAILGNNIAGDWRPEECDVVYSGEIQGACELTTHLVAQGHRHIWFVGNLELPWFARGARGYECAMRAAGLEPRISQIHSDGPELGYLATKSILSAGAPATAIFAGTDQAARGVYTALRESGVPVPRGMSVVGVNDTEASLLQPALTSVREFPEELGRHLADFALRRLETPDLPPQQLTIPTQVVIRESVQAIAEKLPSF